MIPGKKRVRKGDHFEFHVLDSAGCTCSTKVVFRLANASDSDKIRLDSTGTGVVAADAAEGVYSIALDGTPLTAQLEVVSDAQYASLLAREAGSLDDESPIQLALSEDKNSTISIVDKGAQQRQHRRYLLISVIALGCLMLAIAVFVLARKRAPVAQKRATQPATPVKQAPSGRICPVCGTQYGPDAKFCRKDGVATVPRN
jgi:hypothetical protein